MRQVLLFTLWLGVTVPQHPGAAVRPESVLPNAAIAPQLAQAAVCQPPALSRMTRHTIAAGETIESLAQRYNLIPATLMGLNPSLRSGKAPVGTQIVIPPYNGIRVEVKPNQTWRDVAQTYNVRPDVLFEINGCQTNPRVVFVPGVNWTPVKAPDSQTAKVAVQTLAGYPLATKPSPTAILLGYGWGLQPRLGKVGFHSGVDLAAPLGTSVVAVGGGTVAFAAKQGAYGNMVVINHAEGLQTRYAQLGRIAVKPGQVVKRGQVIGTVGTTGTPSSQAAHLHYEVRSRSQLGWVAEDPETYLAQSFPKPSQAQK